MKYIFLLLMILLFGLPIQAEEVRWVRDKDGNITNVAFDEPNVVKEETKKSSESEKFEEKKNTQVKEPTHKRVWKWVDSRGHVHFSDKKMNLDAEEVQHRKDQLNRIGNHQARDLAKIHRIPFRKMGESMVVLGEINGVLTHFIVDTGASLVVVTPEVAQRAGLTVDQENKVHLQTVNGAIDAPKTLLDNLQVAQLSQVNVAAVVQDTGFSDIGLLGMSFLNAYQMTIDHVRHELILEMK